MTSRVLVTGATRGIGRAITDKLVGCGFEVIGLARSRPAWWRGQFLECDLADADAVLSTCKLITNLDELSGLVNNAGQGGVAELSETTFEGMRALFMVNTFSPVILTRAAVERMRRGGRIVNVCSTSMLGRPGRGTYGASKAALASYTRTWALELGHRGISVNAISLGPVDTELFRSVVPSGSPEEARILSAIPMGEIASVESIATLVAFLLQPEASGLNGHVVTFDGGGSIGQARE